MNTIPHPLRVYTYAARGMLQAIADTLTAAGEALDLALLVTRRRR